jgi:hypothetical protein
LCEFKQFIISQTFADGFPLRLMAKDVRTADDMGHALAIPTPMADLCTQLWEAAAQALGERANHTEVLGIWRGWAGERGGGPSVMSRKRRGPETGFGAQIRMPVLAFWSSHQNL